MPTYEYRCPKGHEFELFQRMSDEPRARCPTCGAAAARLLSSGAGFLFKGEGFYITDSRSEDYRKAAKSEGKGGGDAAGTEGGSAKPPAAGEEKDPPVKESPAAPPPSTKTAPKKKGGASSSAP
ncbi:MAG: FmdB family zinc ribbon protein [Gemmatimonadota bacterium]